MGLVTTDTGKDTTFTITNNGCDVLSGVVSETCDHYSITLGAGIYTLNPGEIHTVTVEFRPTSCGVKACTIQTGNAACSNVAFTGEGEDFGCTITPDTLHFGDVPISNTVVDSFTVTNTATCGTVTGTIPASCGDFDITSGSGPFSLNPGESMNVVVEFTPPSAGLKSCTMTTSSAHCPDVTFDGTGI
jgi:hypothetical protein